MRDLKFAFRQLSKNPGFTTVAILTLAMMTSFGLTGVLRQLLYEITPTDLFTFASITSLLLGISFLASWLPARRAARIDPVEALRYE